MERRSVWRRPGPGRVLATVDHVNRPREVGLLCPSCGGCNCNRSVVFSVREPDCLRSRSPMKAACSRRATASNLGANVLIRLETGGEGSDSKVIFTNREHGGQLSSCHKLLNYRLLVADRNLGSPAMVLCSRVQNERLLSLPTHIRRLGFLSYQLVNCCHLASQAEICHQRAFCSETGACAID